MTHLVDFSDVVDRLAEAQRYVNAFDPALPHSAAVQADAALEVLDDLCDWCIRKAPDAWTKVQVLHNDAIHAQATYEQLEDQCHEELHAAALHAQAKYKQVLTFTDERLLPELVAAVAARELDRDESSDEMRERDPHSFTPVAAVERRHAVAWLRGARPARLAWAPVRLRATAARASVAPARTATRQRGAGRPAARHVARATSSSDSGDGDSGEPGEPEPRRSTAATRLGLIIAFGALVVVAHKHGRLPKRGDQ